MTGNDGERETVQEEMGEKREARTQCESRGPRMAARKQRNENGIGSGKKESEDTV